MKLQTKKVQNLKLETILEFQNIKTFSLKGILQVGQKKFLLLIKLKNTVPWTYAISDLNGEELSNVVKNDVIKKTEQNKLVNKVNNIDTSDFVIKTNYNTKITELDNKIPDTSNLVKKTDYNTKITEIEGKIPDISNLATKTA